MSHFVLFFNHWIFNRFLGSTTGSMCCCESHMHAGAHKHIQYTRRCPLPSLCQSLSQMYFIINQLVAHLPACCCFFFFSISIKHLLLLVWNVTLCCVLSFCGCRPWRTCLDYYTSAESVGCYQTQALSQVPRSRHATVKHKEDAAGQRQKQMAPDTDCTGQWLRKTMYISNADERGKTLNLRAIRQDIWNLRTNMPSSFITNRVFTVFSRTEDKLPKMV